MPMKPRGDRDKLERDRRRALDEDDLRAILPQITGGDRELLRQAERGKKLRAHALIEEMADRIAEQPAQHRGERADEAEPQGALRLGKAHQAEQGMRRDREKARFHERDGEQPPIRVAMRRLGEHPLVEACEHIAAPLAENAAPRQRGRVGFAVE
jgi:hypothetical protein